MGIETPFASGADRGPRLVGEVVVLATTGRAQVNDCARFNQGLGVPAAGFFDESVCPLPERLR